MHVVVQPARRGSAVSDTESAAVGSSTSTEAEGGRVGRGRLFPNVKVGPEEVGVSLLSFLPFCFLLILEELKKYSGR